MKARQVDATEILKPDEDGIAAAAAHLGAGRLVAFPTETVYGLGGNACDDTAVASIFAAKGRPSFNPLIVHVPDIEAARRIADLDERAETLARAFWPGPLTLVLPARPEAGLSRLVSAGLPSVAVRVPAHPVAQALLRAAGVPVAAPSANPSGRISPTNAGHVLAGLRDKIAAVLDAGSCSVGVESTIVDATGPLTLLRPGGVSLEALREVTEVAEAPEGNPDRPVAPGQLQSHYAPEAPVWLNVVQATPDALLLGFGGTPGATFDLSPKGDLTEAAANLFAMLHALDGKGLPIAVAPIPETGLGRAINDRLRRAAAPR